MIKVISGNYKGQNGRVIKVINLKNRIIVEGINKVKKHTRPNQQNPQGGIVEKELAVHLSNLAFLSLKDGKKTKIGYKFENNKKIRIEKKTGEIIKNV